MMKPISLTILLVSSAVALGQPPRGGPVSPEVHADRRVTFRVTAPRAAEVTLTADWLPSGKTERLAKDDRGVWSVTVGPLEPGIAIYNFNIDGLAVPDPVNPMVKLRARTSASLVEVPGDGTEVWLPGTVPHGRVELVFIPSQALPGQTREVRVYTPPGYDQDSARKYPVLYLLHGSNDTAAGWTDVGRAHYILDNLIAQKKAVPMLVVMPWGHAVPFGGPQGDNNRLFERFLLDDAMPAVEKTYRVAAGRENRAIAGLSMGGGQAIQIGLGHLDLFSQVGAFSAAVPGDFAARFKSLLDDPDGTNARLKLFFITCGRQDGMFARSRQLDETLTAHRIRHEFRPSEGLHNYVVWRLYLSQLAPMLFR
jgi:enterochelin esterase family protein